MINKMCLGASVYAIWKEKNDRSFSTNMSTKEKIVQKIKRVVRDTGAMLTNIKLINENARIAHNWSLPQCIFKQEKLAPKGDEEWSWFLC